MSFGFPSESAFSYTGIYISYDSQMTLRVARIATVTVLCAAVAIELIVFLLGLDIHILGLRFQP
jgi:hypothetical protein